MLAESQGVYSYFTGETVFSNEMASRLFPGVAEKNTAFPFAIYRIAEQQGQSKDADQTQITLLLYYGPDQYTECITFADACKGLVKSNRKYDWLSSEIDFIEEDQSFVASINFEIT